MSKIYSDFQSYDAPGFLTPPKVFERGYFFYHEQQTLYVNGQGAGIVSLSPVPTGTYCQIDGNPACIPLKSYIPIHTPIKGKVKIIIPQTIDSNATPTFTINIDLKFMIFGRDLESQLPNSQFYSDNLAVFTIDIDNMNKILYLFNIGFPYLLLIKNPATAADRLLTVTKISNNTAYDFRAVMQDSVNSGNASFYGNQCYKTVTDGSGCQVECNTDTNMQVRILLKTDSNFIGQNKHLIHYANAVYNASQTIEIIDTKNYSYFFLGATQAGGGTLAGTIFVYDYDEITGSTYPEINAAIPAAGASVTANNRNASYGRFTEIYLNVTGGAGTLTTTLSGTLWNEVH